MSNLQFKEIEDNKNWDNLVPTLPNYSFLNSSVRFDYAKLNDKRPLRFAIYSQGCFLGILTGQIGTTRFFGDFLDFKHSPLLKESTTENWEEVLDFCKDLAQKNNCFMYRVSPLLESDSVLESVYAEIGAVKSPTNNIDALISQYFDLTKSDEDLRHDMTDSTRNNINKLMKNPDISVKTFTDNSQFEKFADFHDQTKKIKKGYVDRPVKVLLSELQGQIDNNMCYMIVGYFKERPISIWQATVFGKYIHIYQAGSDVEFREKNIRITYLLFWESVKLGKSLGCTVLDLFGGMVPNGYKGKRHPWIGVSSFKESLGGRKVTYMHSRDIPLNKIKYLGYYIYSYIRAVIKGYTVKW